jgi:hypothetical protein
MHNQNKILTGYRPILRLTSLTAAEFFQLLAVIAALWQRYLAHHDLKGEHWRIEQFSEHVSMSLKGSIDKLFFVLIYLKHNPLQTYHGFTFDMSQWLRVLLPILEQELQRLQMLPCREPIHLYLSLQLLSGQVLLLDATERAIPCPSGMYR